ncbi:hypothetical protein HDU96_009334 [Phlyctochytrium bullatum]|nr:hypothetical protein HDU96_009334 [Phlyctochytrium bullatum]
MARLIWLHVEEKGECQKAQKAAAMTLLAGLSYAIKHELRGEHGLCYQDLHGLLPGINSTCFPRKKRTVSHSSISGTTVHSSISGISGAAAHACEAQPLLPSELPHIHDQHHSDYRCGCASLPLAIINQLSVFNASKLKKDEISPAMSSSLHSLINAVVENITGMDRILATRIPHAYGLHLRQVLVLYCMFLPFQIMAGLGWYTGPCLMLVSFVLFGIENLGLEIENPFGYDPNDLPLDRYCENTKREIDDLIRTRRPTTLEDDEFDYKAFLKNIEDDIAEEKLILENTGIPPSVSTLESQQ